MRDITQPPDADRRRRILIRSTILRGISAIAIAGVLILTLTMQKPLIPVIVVASFLLLSNLAWFIWGLQQTRKGN